MRACLLTTNYPPVGGGVSRYNAGIVATASGDIGVAGKDCFSPPPTGDGLVARLRQVWWAFRVGLALSRDIVPLASQPHLAVGVWLAGREFAMFIHGGEWESFSWGQKLLRRFATRAKVCVFSSEATMKRFKPQDDDTDCVVIRPGLSRNVPLKKREMTSQVQARRHMDILCVGRLSPRKGHRKLITAVQDCRDLGFDVSLTCVGSGDLEAELRSLVRPGDSILFATDIGDEQLVALYDEADLFAMVPEEIRGGEAWEGFGIVYLEAAARGLPILGTSTGGVPEATCKGGALLLQENCTASDIARAIVGLYKAPDTRKRMSDANLHWAEESSWASREAPILRLLDVFSRRSANGQ
jgi:glycosyltransferase involved in cell wall biosynthesis